MDLRYCLICDQGGDNEDYGDDDGEHAPDCEVADVKALLDAGKLGERVECDVCLGIKRLYTVDGGGIQKCFNCHGTGYTWRVIK